jgi:hypothetical protein
MKPFRSGTSDTSGSAAPISRSGDTHLTELVALLLIIGLYIAIRIHIVGVPLNRDEGGFAYFGQMLRHGGALYRDTLDHKPPGIWLWYWLLTYIIDFDAIQLHTFLLVYNLATLLLVAAFVRRISSIEAALWSGLTYAIVSSSWQIEGFSASTEMFMLLPIMGSLYLAVLGTERRSNLILAASGALNAWCFWIKQPAAAVGLFLVIYIFIVSYKDRSNRLPTLQRIMAGMRPVMAFSLGFALPSAFLCGYFIATDRWSAFVYWSFTHSLHYAVMYSLPTYFHQIWDRLGVTVFANPYAWALALGTCLIMPIFCRKEGFIVAGFFLSSLVTACHSVFMYRHYMALVTPAVSIATGIGAGALTSRFKGNRISHAAISVLIVLFIFILPLVADRWYYFSDTPFEISRMVFDSNPFPESPVIAKYIRDRTRPDDTVLVLGSEPQILVLAQRRSATRQIFMYPVVGPYRHALKFQRQVLNDIQKNRPAYVVLVKLWKSWQANPAYSRDFERRIDRWLAKNYAVEAIVRSNNGSPVIKKLQDIRGQQRINVINQAHLIILRRLVG